MYELSPAHLGDLIAAANTRDLEKIAVAQEIALGVPTRWRGRKPRVADVVPPDELSGVVVKHLDVDEAMAWATFEQTLATKSAKFLPPGRYAQLFVDGALMMSDTPQEWASCLNAYRGATGDVLIAGLGIGMVLAPLLVHSRVTSVTVVELDQRVIDVVAPFVVDPHKRLLIVCDDARTWSPAAHRVPQRFDSIWLDIWPTVDRRNARDMRMLRKRYTKLLRPLPVCARRCRGRVSIWGETETYALDVERKIVDPYAAVMGECGGWRTTEEAA